MTTRTWDKRTGLKCRRKLHTGGVLKPKVKCDRCGKMRYNECGCQRKQHKEE